MTEEQKAYDAACNKLLNKFKQDPLYEEKLEFGRLLMKHIDQFTTEEHTRYLYLQRLLMTKP